MALNWNDILITVEPSVAKKIDDPMIFASGVPGQAATIDQVTVEQLPYSSTATVENLGTPEHAQLKFGIPRGVPGNESINDNAGFGDTDYVWSADKNCRLNRDVTDLVVYPQTSFPYWSFLDSKQLDNSGRNETTATRFSVALNNGNNTQYVYAGTKIKANEGYKFSYSLWTVPCFWNTPTTYRLAIQRNVPENTEIEIKENGYLMLSVSKEDESDIPDTTLADDFVSAALTMEIYFTPIKTRVAEIKAKTDETYNGVFYEKAYSGGWQTGGWNNSGGGNTTSSFIRTDFFQTKDTIIRLHKDYRLCVGKWSTNYFSSTYFIENIIGAYNNMANVREYRFQGNANEYFKVMIKKYDNSTLTVADASNISICEIINRFSEKADTEDVEDALAMKLNLPRSGYGTAQQVLTSSGTADPEWSTLEPISGDEVEEAVANWLEENPQVFSIIPDKSITELKFANNALRYITPEMFEAVGDGETADDIALQDAIEYAIEHHVVLDGKGKTYALSGAVVPPWATTQFKIRGIYANGSITIQNLNLYMLDNAQQGTSALHIRCNRGEKILLDNVNVEGNQEHQSSTVLGDGNMSGIKIGTAEQYHSVDGSGSICVRNCHISNCYTDCITIGCTDYESCVIENCVIEKAGRNGITDFSINGIVRNVLFRNNGIRTAPRTQYETEPEQIRDFKTRIIEDCIFESDYDNISDIVFLLKIEKVSAGTSDTIEHLIISNCLCKGISIQSQTSQIPSVFKHITIKGCNCDTVRFAPANGNIAENRNMEIIDCNVNNIIISVGNVTISRNKISDAISLNVDNLIMQNNMISKPSATTFSPTATNAVIDGNIFENYTLDDSNITNLMGENIGLSE